MCNFFYDVVDDVCYQRSISNNPFVIGNKDNGMLCCSLLETEFQTSKVNCKAYFSIVADEFV